MRTKFLALLAALAAALGIGLLAPAGASASTQFVGNTECPTYVLDVSAPCQYVQVDRTVYGATGSMRQITFYQFNGAHTLYRIYDTRLQNNTSRAHQLTSEDLDNASGTTVESSGPLAQNIPNGGYVWDQHNTIGSRFIGTWRVVGTHWRIRDWMHNSASGGDFPVLSDQLP